MTHSRFFLLALLVIPLVFAPSARAETNVETTVSVTTQTGQSSARETRNTTMREVIENGRTTRSEIRTSTGSAAERQQLRQENRNEVQQGIRAAQQTFRTERARLHGERLSRRFAWYYERLTDIATRTQLRIDAEKSEGNDVSSAQASLTAGTTKLATAKAAGDKAVSLFAAITVDTWDLQHPQIKAAVEQAALARQAFSDARASLMDAVRALAMN